MVAQHFTIRGIEAIEFWLNALNNDGSDHIDYYLDGTPIKDPNMHGEKTRLPLGQSNGLMANAWYDPGKVLIVSADKLVYVTVCVKEA